MSLPDMLLFMSDQHTPYYSGFYGDLYVDTPNVNRLVEEGTVFDETYTVCPICVPARMAMLSGIRPAKTGIFRNSNALPDLTPTFLHNLVLQGYETVLIGRMHFVGNDQRHGFTKRIAPDCTTISWKHVDHTKTRGVYKHAYGGYRNINLVGGGSSPSSFYDQYVVEQANEYLQQSHEKPQFIVVGLYSPHHPYVGRKDLYEKYLSRVQLSKSFYEKSEATIWKNLSRESVNEELSLEIKAAYCAMIEEMDERLGMVREAFTTYCNKKGSKRLFIYTSDHGDTVGDRNAYGKETFYEKSVKIPLIFAGDNVLNRHEQAPASILDIGPTILEYAGCEPMEENDGASLLTTLTTGKADRSIVYAEGISIKTVDDDKTYTYCFMLKNKQYKYICFSDEKTELMYDTIQDPEERINLIYVLAKEADQLRKEANLYRMDEIAMTLYLRGLKYTRLWTAYENAVGIPYENNMFQLVPPQEFLDLPEIISKNI